MTLKFLNIVAFLIGLPLVAAPSFDEQRKAIASAIVTQPESAIISLLETGIKENKLSQAHSVANGWFQQNQPQNARTLLLAAQAAELSAHYSEAVAFYQQYLGKADLKSDESHTATMRLYKLMVDVLKNKDNSALYYMLNHGEQFLNCPQARQYNTWILDKTERDNRIGFLRHLTIVCQSLTSKDELLTVYTPYFRKAVYLDRRFIGNGRPSDIEYGKLYVQLGNAITHDDQLKRLLIWRGSVFAYNAALYAKVKPIPRPPIAEAEALLNKFPEHVITVWNDLYVNEREAHNVLMRKESDPGDKIALIKKYLPKVSPIVRYRVLKSLSRYDKTLAKGNELDMLNAADRRNMKGVKLLDNKTPEAERIKEYRKLIAHFDLPSTETPFVSEHLVSILGCTPSLWPELMKDASPKREWLLYRVISEKAKISVDKFSVAVPWWDKPPHWAEPALRKIVSEQATKKELSPWLTMAWINAFRGLGFRNKKHSDLAGYPLMDSLKALPAWQKLPYHLRDDIHYGAENVFKIPSNFELVKTAKGLEAKEIKPIATVQKSAIFKDLLALPKDADAKTVAAALKDALLRVKAAPRRVAPLGSSKLDELGPDVLNDASVLSLLLQVLDSPYIELRNGHNRLSDRVFDNIIKSLLKTKDSNLIHRSSGLLWNNAMLSNYANRGVKRVSPLFNQLINTDPSAAATFSRAAKVFCNQEPVQTTATNIINRANQAMQLSTIAVDESDPDFPVYKAQNEFVLGNLESAWKLFEEHSENTLSIHRKLSADYLIWVLERLIDQRDEVKQEELAKLLRTWRDESAAAFTKSQSIHLDILYGDIARKMGKLEDAHKIYRSIQLDKNNAGVAMVHQATLRQIDVERITKNFPAALETVNALIAKKVPELWAEARYAKAEIFYDQDDYDEASEIIDAILKNQPGHKDATILDGKIKNKTKDLIGASEIEIGSTTQQSTIVPGDDLKVTLNDPSLAVGNASTDIEVVVWSETAKGERGDEELVMLRPFGDSKTKFRGTVPVKIGEIKKNDKTLQVVGDDKVFFSYSDRFKKKVGGTKDFKGGPLSIVSDATLMASARTLLSLADQRQEDAELILSEVKVKNLEALDPVKRQEVEERIAKVAEERRMKARVKPGNPIYLRVVDNDRSRTTDIDTLKVTVSSSSGDTVNNVVLTETGTHTGIFEKTLQSREAQAMAFATTTRTGANPNMVISPKDYPAWRSAVGKEKGKAVFTVDLNDNVLMDTLKISTTEPGMALKKFRLTTGMNRSALRTAATWPTTESPKDPLAPSLFITRQFQDRERHGNAERPENVYNRYDLAAYLDKGFVLQSDPKVLAKTLSGPSQAFSKQAWLDTPWVKAVNHPNHVNVFHASRFRAHFYEEREVTRQFRVTLGKAPKELAATTGSAKKPRKWKVKPGKYLPCIVTVDDRPLSMNGLTYETAVKLDSGLHRLEILSQGRASAIGFGRSCKVQTRLSEDEAWEDCPDSMFNPDTFPAVAKTGVFGPASITPNKEGTEWTVKFAEGSRARVLSLEFLQHNGPEASLSKLTLTNAEGETVLPVKEDFAEQTKNDTLEILTGDRVWVRYVDDRFTAKRFEKHERQLQVAFSDSRVHFSDVEPFFGGNRRQWNQKSEAILRYQMGKKLSVVVDDLDMDSTDNPDTLELTLMAGNQKKTFTATEIRLPAGRFRVFVTPTTGPGTGKNELKVAPGDVIHLSYLDKENHSPGVPTVRMASIKHAQYVTPKMMITNMAIKPASEYHRNKGRSINPDDNSKVPVDPILPTMAIENTYVDATSPEAKALTFILGGIPCISVIAPHCLITPQNRIRLFIQTDSDRQRAKAGTPNGAHAAFDVSIPGTRMLTGTPLYPTKKHGTVTLTGKPWRLERNLLPVFAATAPEPYDGEGSEHGMFFFPLTLNTGFTPPEGELADESMVLKYATVGTTTPLTEKQRLALENQIGKKPVYRRKGDYELTRCRLLDDPIVKPGEKVHIGLLYEDEAGKKQWLTASATLATYGQFDVKVDDGKSLSATAKPSLGDRLRVRVFDQGFDKSSDMDEMTVTVASKDGKSYPLTLRETEGHSGVFEGSFVLAIATKAPTVADGETYDINTLGFPGNYGDTISISFTDSAQRQLPPKEYSLGVGADGEVKAFSKQYSDGIMAAKTQFAMAEAYLEVAKRYHKLKQLKESKLAFQSAKRLLVSTLDQFTDSDTRAHAEYLLGNLTYEEANNTVEQGLREERYQASLARFQKVTSDYPQTLYASMAQFKKAVVYERLNEPNVAAQEYVKLAYRFPESEYLAVALARLGTHFLKTGSKLDRQSKPLLAKTDDNDAQYNGTKLLNEAYENYEISGKIFERLLQKFPNHELAAKGGLLSGKSFMRTKNYHRALDQFKTVRDEESYDGVARAEAMYWAGKCFNELKQYLAAYAVFMRCTNDYPETKWSGYSLSELAQPRLQEIDKDYEINRIEKGLIK